MTTKSKEKYIVLKLKQEDESDETVSKLEICRICLKKGSVPIFEPMPKIGLIKLIKVVTDLSIDEFDEYPKYLCHGCYRLLKHIVVLVKTARRSRDILENNIICMSVDEEDIETFKDLAEKEMLNTMTNEEEPVPDQIIETLDQEYIETEDVIETIETLDEEIIGTDFNIEIVKQEYIENEDTENNILLESEVLTSNKTEEEKSKYKVKTKPNTYNTPVKELKPKIVQCPICHKGYRATYIKYHIGRHKNPNAFICDVCGKSFPLKQPLERHRIIHESKFPHQCKLCPYRGRHAESLKIHMLCHTDLKKYLCNVCGMKFNHQSNRNRHEKNHEKSKFDCIRCNKSYNRETFLVRHNLKTHNEGVSHDCDICLKMYASVEQLRKHKYKAHKIYAKGTVVRLPKYKYEEE